MIKKRHNNNFNCLVLRDASKSMENTGVEYAGARNGPDRSQKSQEVTVSNMAVTIGHNKSQRGRMYV